MSKEEINNSDSVRTVLSTVHKRAMTLGNVDAEKRTVEMSFSSDIPYERFPNFIEVLSHEDNAVDLSRMNSGANVLFNHDHDKVVGVVESAKIGADKKGRAVVRFGKSDFANQVWQDVQDGILRNVSVGYKIMELKQTGTREDGADIYTATSWMPFEVSLVSVPADPTVGINRSVEVKETKTEINQSTNKITIMSENPKPDALAIERERVRTILSAGKEYNSAELAQEFVGNGKSVDDFRSALLEVVNKRNQKLAEASKPIGLSEKEVRNFSFVNLLRALSAPQDTKAREQARFELEACQTASEKLHRSARGTVIPVDVLMSPLSRGTDIIGITSASGYTGSTQTVATQLLSGSFIDLLRKKTLAMQLGSQLGGLVGNIDIPKQTAGTTGYWIGEDAVAPTEDVEFGLIELRGKTVASKSEITRKMLMQSSIDVEALVRSDLAKGLAQTIDTAFFYGDGQNGTPKGIKHTAGVSSFYWADTNKPTFAELVRMETEVESQNYDSMSSAYVFNSAMRGYLKTTKKFGASGTDATLFEQGGTVNGYRSEVSNQINNGDIFYGDFSQALIGLWGGLEINIDPYSGSDRGRIRVVAMQDVDFAIRYAQAFSLAQID
jgi:HK97 family phage major capsid protein/HK97 family phage prohead protease